MASYPNQSGKARTPATTRRAREYGGRNQKIYEREERQ
jgi:hypothetical protein